MNRGRLAPIVQANVFRRKGVGPPDKTRLFFTASGGTSVEPEITRQGCRETSELGPSDRPGPKGSSRRFPGSFRQTISGPRKTPRCREKETGHIGGTDCLIFIRED